MEERQAAATYEQYPAGGLLKWMELRQTPAAEADGRVGRRAARGGREHLVRAIRHRQEQTVFW
jgi:hypothetical protein